MKIKCALSGESFALPELPSTKMLGVHPIFQASPASLIQASLLQLRKPTGDKESRLLALALLHTSQLATWETVPPICYESQRKAVFTALPRLIEFHQFMLARDYHPVANFAHVIVTENNSQSLEILDSASYIWLENIKEYFNGYRETKERQKAAEQSLFLSRLASNSRKPKRYIMALAKSIATSLVLPQSMPLEQAEYLLTWAGLAQAGLTESMPRIPITRASLNQLFDIMLDQLNLDSPHNWKAMKMLERYIESGHYSQYGGQTVLDLEAEKERESRKLGLIQSLGPRPQGFIEGILYDAKIIKLLEGLQ